MAGHPYQHIQNEDNITYEFLSERLGFVGPFNKIGSANSFLMAIRELGISTESAKNIHAGTNELIDMVTTSSTGLTHYGELMEIEQLWVGFDLSRIEFDLKSMEEMLKSIYTIITRKENKCL